MERLRTIIEQRFRILWLTVALCLIGVFLYEKTRIELLPESKQNRIVVAITAQDPIDVPTQAALDRVIREAVSTTGIAKHVRTEATANSLASFISVQDGKSTNLDSLRIILRSKLATIPLALNLQVARLGPSSIPVMSLIVTAKESAADTGDFVTQSINNEIIPRLSQSESVTFVKATGLQSKQIALKINLPEVQSSGGRIADILAETASLASAKQSYLTTSFGKINLESREPGLQGFSKASLAIRNGNSPTVGSIFSMNQAVQENTPLVMKDSVPAVLLDVFKSDSASEIDTSSDVKRILRQLKMSIPKLKIIIASDSATYIQAAQDNVMENLKWGIILTCLCILVFVRNMRYTVIVSISIPVSLALSFLFFPAFGVTRNVMSLAGVTLSVGVVVDATISIIDSIDENMTGGLSPLDSAARAIRDNFIPILSTSLTTFAVFIPILFVPGTVGDLFADLSLTVIISQMVAFIVAILIIPGLTSGIYEALEIRMHGSKSKENRAEETDNLWSRLFVGWTKYLTSTPILYWGISIALLLVALWSVAIAPPSEFLPRRQGEEFRAIVAPTGQLSDTARRDLMSKLDSVVKSLGGDKRLIIFQDDELRADFSINGIQNKNISKIEEQISRALPPYRIRLAYRNPIDPEASSGQDLDLLTAIKSMSKLEELKREINNIPGVVHQLWSQDFSRANAAFRSSDLRAMALPSPPDTAFSLWKLIYASTTLGIEHGDTNGASPPQLIRLLPRDELPKLHPAGGGPVPDTSTSLLESFRTTPTNSVLFDGTAVQKIILTIRNKTANEVAFAIEKAAKNIGVVPMWGDGKEESDRSIRNLALCFLIAAIVIITVLLIQTRSISTTIIILFTFIWGLIGSFAGLVAHKETLNASAIVGFILLAGTIVNNGILLMDIVRKQQSRQFAPRDCCLQAVSQRTVPVLVTAFTTAVGMIPMVFDTGEGSQMYRALSIVVVYGTSVSTPISLVAIPCMVMIVNDLIEWIGKLKLRIAIHTQSDIFSKEIES